MESVSTVFRLVTVVDDDDGVVVAGNGSWEMQLAEVRSCGLRGVLVAVERVGRHWVCTDLSTQINMSNRLFGLVGGCSSVGGGWKSGS